jgi:3-mercaptopyruvate sulfurtransferase SseA
MIKKTSILLAIFILFASACSSPTQTPATPTVAPTFTPPPASSPATEADVPRVTVREAKAAFENGAAVIVDVRSPAAFEMSHVLGAISIPLANIEANSIGLKLDKNQWIIAYCT